MSLPMLVQNVSSKSSSSLSMHAANHCIADIATLVGRGILLGRIEYDDEREIICRVLEDAKYDQHAAESFSPFGPAAV